MNESRQLILVELMPEVSIDLLYSSVEEMTENMCPDCDSLLEQSFDGNGNSRYFCDNCGTLVKSATTLSTADMDITQESQG